MKRLFFVLLCFLSTSVFSQVSKTQYPGVIDGVAVPTNQDTVFTTVAGGDSSIFEFHFSGSDRGRNLYSRFATVFVFFDSLASVGDGQGTRIYARPLIYDAVNNDWVHIAEPNSTATDSVNIVNNANWQTNNTDSTYSFSKVLNFTVNDGAWIVAAADSSNAGFRIRFVLKKAEDTF